MLVQVAIGPFWCASQARSPSGSWARWTMWVKALALSCLVVTSFCYWALARRFYASAFPTAASARRRPLLAEVLWSSTFSLSAFLFQLVVLELVNVLQPGWFRLSWCGKALTRAQLPLSHPHRTVVAMAAVPVAHEYASGPSHPGGRLSCRCQHSRHEGETRR
jgi:hypothetical protein